MKIRFLIFLLASFLCALVLAKHDVTHTGIETSRLATVESVLERGTFAIEDSFFTTSDKVAKDGHEYGDKPPLPTFAAIGFGRVLKLFGVRFVRGDYCRALYWNNVFFFVLSSLVCWLVYLGLRRRERIPEPYRIAMSVLAFASTLAVSYATTLNNHTLCAVVLMGLVLLLETCERDGLTRGRAFCCGVMAGVVFNLDFIAGGVFGVSVFVYVLLAAPGRKWPQILLYAVGAGLLLAAEAAMNMVSYGSPLPLYLWSHHPEFAGKNYLWYAFNILFGFEGFFLYMPALLFACCACASPRMRRDRVFVLVMGSAAATVLLLIAGTSDYGGWCCGYRFLIPFAPVMLYYAAVYFGRPRPRLKRWQVFRAALLWGVATSCVAMLNPWNAGYEGSSTPEGSLPEHFKNGLMANMFVFCWQHAPGSATTQFFMDRVYGREYAMLYLLMELNNRNDREGLQRVQAEIRAMLEAEAAQAEGQGAPTSSEPGDTAR